MLTGELMETGNTKKLKVGFEYREYAGFTEELNSNEWVQTETIETGKGNFELKADMKPGGKTYQFRAFAQHPKLRVYGDVVSFSF